MSERMQILSAEEIRELAKGGLESRQAMIDQLVALKEIFGEEPLTPEGVFNLLLINRHASETDVPLPFVQPDINYLNFRANFAIHAYLLTGDEDFAGRVFQVGEAKFKAVKPGIIKSKLS